ncbi:MAG TPA: P83/100 family protein [bacterium]|nr:P83/100 family protein [bacterium]
MLFLCLAAAGAWAQQVDTAELGSTAGRTFNFESYTGPQPVVETVPEISGIGEVLSRSLRADGTRGDYFGKYSVIRAFQPGQTLLGADIIVLSPRAQIDDIRNVQRIVAGYLAAAFGYDAAQADRIAAEVMTYNAAWRGNVTALAQKYTPLVMSYVTAENAGISLSYADWPGKTRLIVPLDHGLGGTPAAGGQAGGTSSGGTSQAAGTQAGGTKAGGTAQAGGVTSGGSTAGGANATTAGNTKAGGTAASSGSTQAGTTASSGTTTPSGTTPAGSTAAGSTAAGSTATGSTAGGGTTSGGSTAAGSSTAAQAAPSGSAGQPSSPGAGSSTGSTAAAGTSSSSAAQPRGTPALFGILWWWWLIGLAALLVLALLVFLAVRLIQRLSSPSYERELARSVQEGHPLVEMVVIPQNRHIGHRNIHYLRPGSTASVGSGGATFLIYFVPVPRRLAQLKYDGRAYSFVPLRSELFPGTSGAIADCLGKGIPARSLRGYRFTIIFRRFTPPLEEINRLMRSTRAGAPRRIPPARS